MTLTVGLIAFTYVEFTQAKIAERNVAGIIEQNVLGLQVAVNDVEAVQTF